MLVLSSLVLNSGFVNSYPGGPLDTPETYQQDMSRNMHRKLFPSTTFKKKITNPTDEFGSSSEEKSSLLLEQESTAVYRSHKLPEKRFVPTGWRASAGEGRWEERHLERRAQAWRSTSSFLCHSRQGE